jgi:hypothetical protein
MGNVLSHQSDQALTDDETLRAKIAAVMAEARRSAADAFATFAASAEKTADGRIAAPPGGAYVYASRPSYAFRTIMMEAGEMEDSLSGRWNVGRFQDVVEDRSITAAEVACEAGVRVLREHFPDETFSSTSFLT